MNNLLKGILKINVILFILCFYNGAIAQNLNEEYSIYGSVKGISNGTAVLGLVLPYKTIVFNDSSKIVDGKFKFNGHLDQPIWVVIGAHSDSDKAGWLTSQFMLDAGDIELSVFGGDEDLVTGSRQNALCQSLEQKYQHVFDSISKAEKNISDGKMENDTSKVILARQDEQKALQDIKKIVIDNLNGENKYVAAYWAYQFFKNSTWREREEILNNAPEELLKSVYLKPMNEDTKRAKLVDVGNIAPDFELFDLDGKRYTNVDFKGKYYILEFSASWCHWCKVELPYLKELHQSAKDKNFELITVNVDKKKEDWRDDVLKEDLPWKVLSDMKAFGGIAKSYNVRGIPQMFLINPEGKIIAKGLRGKKVITTVNNFLLD